ncbi:penicillin-binding protein 1A [Thiohalocapsa marina]|uniref:penicillin-binding protein 1A n=1 Tax=Thiohalocapsa marina TaxID=424902 RepID=UPI001FE8D78B|nr:PBP1A family penicillin-binding protein [Thiohalocapsa marina]
MGPVLDNSLRHHPHHHPEHHHHRRWGLFALFDWFARLVATPLAVPLDLAMLGLIGASVIIHTAVQDLPDTDTLLEVKFEEPLRIYTADGSLMGEFGVQRRRAVAFDAIPPDLVNAFLAAEDSRFFDHIGFDPVGLARATYAVIRSGTPSQGGSTITMQVARNFFLTPEKTFQRKLSEILLAMRMEATLSKTQILELYLNKIFFGHRAYGVSTAAELYYNKTLYDLTLAEMATLAGLPKAPSANNPLSNPERALERRNYILDRMLALGYIDAERHATARAAAPTALPYQPPIAFRAGYVAEMARQEVVRRFGDEQAYSLGLRVITTLDERLQQSADAALRQALTDYNQRHGYHGAEAQLADIAGWGQSALDADLQQRPDVPGLPVGIVTAVDAQTAEVYLGDGRSERLQLSQVEHLRRYRTENRRGPRPRRVSDVVTAGDVVRLRQATDGRWLLTQVPTVGGALVALQPEDGAIRALSGGYAFEWSKFNRAADARRQPGSTFKPFVYAAGLGKGYTPASLVRDEPQVFGDWAPRNADDKHLGPIRIRVALTRSRNLATVNLIDRMGVDYTREFVQRFGFRADDVPPNYSLALGSGATTPVQLAAAYGVFANGGYRIEPYLIQRIEDVQGRLLFEADPPRACVSCWLQAIEGQARVYPVGASDDPDAEQVLDPRIVYNMDSMLRNVITAGTATRARQLKRDDIAGKTGTTNEARDSWFAGYVPALVAVAWMGMDDNRPLGRGEWGGTAALGMWIDFMRDALVGIPVAEIRRPDGLVSVRIDANTGQPRRDGEILEYIRTEYQLDTQGPDPIAYARDPGDRTAPRMMDELF